MCKVLKPYYTVFTLTVPKCVYHLLITWLKIAKLWMYRWEDLYLGEKGAKTGVAGGNPRELVKKKKKSYHIITDKTNKRSTTTTTTHSPWLEPNLYPVNLADELLPPWYHRLHASTVNSKTKSLCFKRTLLFSLKFGDGGDGETPILW